MSIDFSQFLGKIRTLQCKIEKFPFNNLNLQVKTLKTEFKVVICGDCSVGKSSLLSRLLGKQIESFIKEPKFHALTSDTEGEIEFIQLPGLTEIAQTGQSADFPAKTADWFDFHVSKADLVLLCVAADADLVNSNGLKRIKNLNADSKTILVLSKLDLLEDHKISKDYLNVLQQLTGEFDSIIAVRNEKREFFYKADRLENQFFVNHFDFDCESIKFGINEVNNRIFSILNEKLTGIEREFKFQLMKIKRKLEERLKQMKSTGTSGNCTNNPNSFLKLITDYIDQVNQEISGEVKSPSGLTVSDEFLLNLSPGMRISLILWNNFPETIKAIDPLDGIYEDQLETLIKNSQGLNSSCFQLENAFKHLIRQQLKVSEIIVSDCTKMIYKEMKDCLLLKVKMDESTTTTSSLSSSSTTTTLTLSSDEEFYDINSVSDVEEYFEQSAFSEENYTLRAQLEMIPNICEAVNERVGKLLNQNYNRCLRYLKEYAEMQAETIYTDSPQFQQVVKEFYQNRPTWLSSSLTNLVNDDDDDDEIIEEEREIAFNPIDEGNESGFLKEFIALIFPPVPNNIKRVEYRPQQQSRESKIIDKPSKKQRHAIVGKKSLTKMTKDEEFLLKVVDIYMKLYHGQLCDFVPKCVNYHLIRGTLKALPSTLLSDSKWTLECGDAFTAIKRDLKRKLEVIIEDLNKFIN